MDDGTYKVVASYATELERLRQVNAALLEAAISALPYVTSYCTNYRCGTCDCAKCTLERAINLAEGK